jgi:hypothetical protein
LRAQFWLAGRINRRARRSIGSRCPEGWNELIDERRVLASGFEAGYFQRGNEIVISYAGTGALGDWAANAGLALGA